jgi:type II secretory pathway predicted ATPase ExeA
MSAYLKFFALERSPFEGAAQSSVVLGTKALRSAFEAIRSGLSEDAARICVSGGPGLGKTSLARSLPKLLRDEALVALILDPSGSWDSLRESIASQWSLPAGSLARSSLLEAARDHRLVLVIDRGEAASIDLLDHLDILLSYRTPDDKPVVQSVVLANLAAGDREEPPPLIWWLDRIHTLQLEFAPLPRSAIAPYIDKHLARAGWQGKSLFAPEAAHAIHELTGGIPGEVGRVCERLLSEAATQHLSEIDADFVLAICDDESGAADAGKLAQEEADTAPIGDDASQSDAFATDHETSFDRPCDDDPDDEERDTAPFRTLDDELSRPASPEELRALFGGGLARYTRTVAMIAAALVLAAIGLGLLLGGEDEPQTTPGTTSSSNAPQAVQPLLGEAAPTTTTQSAEDSGPPVLARMRGPVTPGEIEKEESGAGE